MALTDKQKQDVIDKLNKLSDTEIDSILENMHRFTDWLYYNCKSIYDEVKYTIKSMWNWIKSLF